jgi:hypothetical protein
MAEGADWYDRAHEIARELDPEDPDRAAAVIAVLSPLERWERNVELAREAYALGRLERGTLKKSIDKANRILAGEDPADVVSGPKVTRFYRTISDPQRGKDDVVIDRHAFDVAVGRKTDDATRSKILSRKGEYDRFVRAYARAAKILGARPGVVQAVTWTVWRDAYGE